MLNKAKQVFKNPYFRIYHCSASTSLMIFYHTWNKIQIPSPGLHSLARASGHNKIRCNRTPSRESWCKDHKMGRSSTYLKIRKKASVISSPTILLSLLLPSSHSGFISVLSYSGQFLLDIQVSA